MDIKDLLTLANAGFTKDDIASLLEPKEQKVTEPTVETKEVTQQKTETPKETTSTSLLTDEQFDKLAQLINKGNASIDLPQKKSTEDTLSEHFKNLVIGG